MLAPWAMQYELLPALCGVGSCRQLCGWPWQEALHCRNQQTTAWVPLGFTPCPLASGFNCFGRVRAGGGDREGKGLGVPLGTAQCDLSWRPWLAGGPEFWLKNAPTWGRGSACPVASLPKGADDFLLPTAPPHLPAPHRPVSPVLQNWWPWRHTHVSIHAGALALTYVACSALLWGGPG